MDNTKMILDLMGQVSDLQKEVLKIREAQLKLESSFNRAKEDHALADMQIKCLHSMVDIINQKINCITDVLAGEEEDE